MRALLVMTTCENPTRADELASALVGERLAACINIVPTVSSVYRWQDRVERDSEALLLIKTTEAKYPEVEAAIRARSTYELPEVLAVPLAAGSNDYLRWVEASTED